MRSWHEAGVADVVSLLTPDEMNEMELQHEEDLCQANGIQFLSFPIYDRSVPPLNPVTARVLERIDADLARGKNVTVHWRQGIGRT
jgi:protein-tyrosine phosphatase